MTHTTLATALSVFLLSMAATASAAPCITATTACTEWVTAGLSPARTLVYRSFPLDARNTDVTRAVVMVHGAGRDADNYFLHTLAAAFLGAALDDTVVISPRFASNNGGCADALGPAVDAEDLHAFGEIPAVVAALPLIASRGAVVGFLLTCG